MHDYWLVSFTHADLWAERLRATGWIVLVGAMAATAVLFLTGAEIFHGIVAGVVFLVAMHFAAWLLERLADRYEPRQTDRRSARPRFRTSTAVLAVVFLTLGMILGLALRSRSPNEAASTTAGAESRPDMSLRLDRRLPGR